MVLLGHTEKVNHPPEFDPQKVRIGLMVMGAVLVLSIALAIFVSDPVGRFVFVFVAVVCLVQLIRVRRRYTKP